MKFFFTRNREANKDFKKKLSSYFDFGLLAILVLLIGIGLASIFSATYDAGTSDYFYKQLFFALVGFVAIVVITFLPEKWISFNAIFIYIASILLLIAVLFFGKTVSGTTGWFQWGALSFQPAEMAKVATLIMVARFLSQKGIDIQNLRDLLTVAGLFALAIGLIVLQPDMGSASVLVILLYGVLFWVGFDLFTLYFLIYIPFAIIMSLLGIWFFIASMIIFIITVIIFKKNILQTSVFILFIFTVSYFAPNIMELMPQNTQDRIEIFINPNSDPLNKGYNVMQSVLAVGSGGITGKGFLKGSQTQLRYIPEQRTDFIFCVPTEEFGFIGGAVVIAVYSLLLWRILKIAVNTNSTFFSITSFGICTIFFYHAVINIGMVIRIMPVMGIPLPFMSYGGSALLVNMAMIGLLMNAYRNQKKSY